MKFMDALFFCKIMRSVRILYIPQVQLALVGRKLIYESLAQLASIIYEWHNSNQYQIHKMSAFFWFNLYEQHLINYQDLHSQLRCMQIRDCQNVHLMQPHQKLKYWIYELILEKRLSTSIHPYLRHRQIFASLPLLPWQYDLLGLQLYIIREQFIYSLFFQMFTCELS